MAVIDLNVINNLKNLSGEKAFLSNLIDIFVKDTPVLIAGMEKAFKNKDPKELKSAAHKYKSTTRQLGALELSSLCLEIEELAKALKHTDKSIPDKISKIKNLATQAINTLKEIKSQHLKS
jgi:HPt (histidine-containing phosphotransfer) domain-containing protein